ncbi:MAG TPA: hypothetical protein DEP28_02540 [Bacteroidetes bacterium]|nr:hypothetical protein [Bacteroidota bacterium]HCN37819.1 hypothetical protein [Bacteroidota bacterium]
MKKLEDLINSKLSRRNVLKATAAVILSSAIPAYIRAENTSIDNEPKLLFSNNPFLTFKPIPPSDADELILPEGFKYDIIRMWGDKVNDSELYGTNNDFVAYFPINNKSDDGLLVVNHEFPSPLLSGNYTDADWVNKVIKTSEQIDAERKSVGISVFRVKRENNKWSFVNDEKFNKRIDANSEIVLTGKAANTPETFNTIIVRGTVANCSGGVTPWNTYLSGEENFQDYGGEEYYRWNDNGEKFIEEHYGWVVEVNPYDKNSVPKKRTSLGRFRHENVCIALTNDNHVVAYMGDDKVNECVYKFISKNKFYSGQDGFNSDLLDEGDLYVADFENGKWHLLDYEKQNVLKNNFKSQADVLLNCDKSSKLVGGTECNRPEDIEINPVDKNVYIAFTNNSLKKDYFGNIVCLKEKNGDYGSLEFEWDVLITGGEESGMSCPDNLTFDNSGNLWALTDISTGSLNKTRQLPFKNNSVFMIPTSGENKGKAFRFASGPVECEVCGGSFTPDGSTMFLSIQHPGENSPSLDKLTSHWPNGGDDIPRSTLVAMTGFK